MPTQGIDNKVNMNKHAIHSTNYRALRISAILIFIYFFIEVFVAIKTGSLSLLADAAHEFSTVIAITISLVAVWLADKKATPKRTYGYQRAEILAALINGVLLLGMAIFIIVRGVQRLYTPVEMSSLPMFAMAIGGIGLEIASLIIMYKGQKESLNMKGSYWHIMNAFLGSIAVIIAAIFIAVANYYQADTWAGIIFALILIYAAYGIIKDSLNILLDKAPDKVDVLEIEKELLTIPGVVSVHHLHSRTVSSNITSFSAHMVVGNLANSEQILENAKQILEKQHGFSLTTLQLEDKNTIEADPRRLEYHD